MCCVLFLLPVLLATPSDSNSPAHPRLESTRGAREKSTKERTRKRMENKEREKIAWNFIVGHSEGMKSGTCDSVVHSRCSRVSSSVRYKKNRANSPCFHPWEASTCSWVSSSCSSSARVHSPTEWIMRKFSNEWTSWSASAVGLLHCEWKSEEGRGRRREVEWKVWCEFHWLLFLRHYPSLVVRVRKFLSGKLCDERLLNFPSSLLQNSFKSVSVAQHN